MKAANKMEIIPPSSTLRVLALAKELERQGKKIVHLEVGEPDFDTPDHIKEAAYQALKKGMTKYTPSTGLPELKEAIVEHLKHKGIITTPKNLIITPGAKHAIFCALLAALDPLDEVIIPSPCWTYEGMVLLAGGRPVFVKTSGEDGFRLHVEDVERAITRKTKMILLNYPNNPTGAVLEREDLRAVVDLAEEKNLWILSDEIYDALVYDGEHVSVFPEAPERTIYVNGFSKTYAMTGWRLGYAVAPQELISEMDKVQQASTSCVPGFVQQAGVAALQGPQDFVEKMREEYRRRRDLISEGLNSIEGVSCPRPRGAFYAFPSMKNVGINSVEFCERLLKKAGVAAVPGSGFGPYGEGHIRLSFAASPESIREGINGIRKVVESISG
ncbi:MAG: pyridoxal phosphate-dependent aminotransferase [Candidatus Hadarchaeales archaeon]